MSYQAKINGDGTYTVTHNGRIINDAKVRRIEFEEITTHTLNDPIHHITGRAVATVELPNGKIIHAQLI